VGVKPYPSCVAEVAPLERHTMAQRAAEYIQESIRNGGLVPGQPVPEAVTAAVLGVSRNTVREAFRLLGGEGLLVHNIHRGVVVKELGEADVRDIYIVRRSLELGALRPPLRASGDDLERLREAVAAAEEAALRADWRVVSTLNLHFHQGLVALRRSPRIDQFFARVLAELRLAFASVADQPEFLRPYVAANWRLYRMLAAGRWEDAARELEAYLARSEQTVLQAVLAAGEAG
jgi:DNA-binding GntR family transcriptional regulator